MLHPLERHFFHAPFNRHRFSFCLAFIRVEAIVHLLRVPVRSDCVPSLSPSLSLCIILLSFSDRKTNRINNSIEKENAAHFPVERIRSTRVLHSSDAILFSIGDALLICLLFQTERETAKSSNNNINMLLLLAQRHFCDSKNVNLFRRKERIGKCILDIPGQGRTLRGCFHGKQNKRRFPQFLCTKICNSSIPQWKL